MISKEYKYKNKFSQINIYYGDNNNRLFLIGCEEKI